MPRNTTAVAVLVGLPEPVRKLVEQRVRPHVLVRPIYLKRDGGHMLAPPNSTVARMIEDFANNDVPVFERALILVLPYTTPPTPTEVVDAIDLVVSLGAKVYRAQSGSPPWPARPPQMDNKFQNELATAIAALIDSIFPEEALSDEHREVCSELLRGLASHTKMGENNHSHEDDLWKTRGQGLGSSERKMIVERLLKAGILGRKKNNSMGGTGWVYWISDVQIVRRDYPELEPYFQ